MATGTLELPPHDKSGFLAEFSNVNIFNASLYIAAMGRSGSTVLCDLLTHAPEYLCLIEPWFVTGVRNQHTWEQLQSFKLTDFTLSEWKSVKTCDQAGFLERYRNLLGPQLNGLIKWGVKEVRPEFHHPTIKTINPSHILILIRNVEDVVASLYKKHTLSGDTQEETFSFIESYVPNAAKSLLELHVNLDSSKTLTVRYEDFFASIEERNRIERKLDWPMYGQPNKSFTSLNREVEASKHRGALTPPASHSLDLLPKEVRLLAERLSHECHQFQATFGYL